MTHRNVPRSYQMLKPRYKKFVMKCGIGKKQLKISFKKGQVLYLTVYGVRI